MYSSILFERKARIAVITLNRPRVLNALSRALKAELSDALKVSEEASHVAAIAFIQNLFPTTFSGDESLIDRPPHHEP